MKGPNPIIGTVPCPIGGCTDTCQVRKFRDQAGAALTRRRKAGKFYFDCPTHGRFGFDGNPAMQEHVLEKITWSDESAKAAAGGAPASSTTAASPPSRASSGASPAKSPSSKPATARPAGTSSGTQTATQTQTPAKTKSAWWEDLL